MSRTPTSPLSSLHAMVADIASVARKMDRVELHFSINKTRSAERTVLQECSELRGSCRNNLRQHETIERCQG
jgi:hypothetical protein